MNNKYAIILMVLGLLVACMHYAVFGFTPIPWEHRLPVLSTHLFAMGFGLWVGLRQSQNGAQQV